MPPLFDDAIRSLRGDEARGPFRGMCYNASITELLSVLNVGSISVNLHSHVPYDPPLHGGAARARTSLRTLSEARFAQDGTGALLLERTTLFAEAQCTLGDRRLRLFCPLSPLAHRLAETTAQRLKYHPAEFLLPWRMLRGEFTYTDATGTQRTCDLVAQELPAEGEPLATAVGHADRDRLLSALDTLQRQLAQAGLTHNNLKAANLWMTPDYRLLPLRYAYMRFDGGDDAPQFDALRAFVAEKGLRGTNDVRYLGGVQRTVHRFSEPPLGRTHVRTDDLRRGRRRIRLRRHAKPLSHRPAIPLGQRFPRRPRRGADRRRADGAHRQDGPLRPRTALRNRRNTTTGRDVCWPASTDVGPPSTTRAVNSPSSAP